jgi:hypothetical protein
MLDGGVFSGFFFVAADTWRDGNNLGREFQLGFFPTLKVGYPMTESNVYGEEDDVQHAYTKYGEHSCNSSYGCIRLSH